MNCQSDLSITQTLAVFYDIGGLLKSLTYLISDAKNNPNKYESIVTNAYNKCVSSYTVDNFLADFIYPLSNRT